MIHVDDQVAASIVERCSDNDDQEVILHGCKAQAP
jgi:hypothetical protein